MARSGPKIVGGRLRGRSLRVVGTARPTEGRVREALFNIWSARIVGCRFLDLFAGSGAMGFEALSRGASWVAWVEKHGGAAAAIRRNAASLAEQVAGSWSVVRADLPAQVHRLGPVDPAWDLVYADPPYAFGAYDELLRAVAPRLAAAGTLAVEHAGTVDVGAASPAGMVVTDHRRWGDCSVTFFAASSFGHDREPLDGGGAAA